MTVAPLILDAKVWRPHAYQERAVSFLMEREAAALWQDPGLGKTSITLEAFRRLQEAGKAKRMLVVAPLIPMTETWPHEMRKWRQFLGLTFCTLHGSKKLKTLRADAHKADISLINFEGLAWLLKNKSSMPAYDVVCYDEHTKLKNSRAGRSKAARALFWSAPYRWGLTGTPAANGYEDVFGQILSLDRGEALGKTLSQFRTRYYAPHPYLMHQWELLPGAVDRIESRVAPITLRMAAADYLDLPERIDDVRKLHMTDAVSKQYKALKRDMLLSLPGGVITAANAAATYSKLAQLANGAIYQSDDKWEELHAIKLDALAGLREELGGEQLLLCYEFRHDIARIAARFPDAAILKSTMSKSKRAEIMAAWNSGELKMLCIHPASAGHGLNLQGSGAHHICWFSATWSLELYEQAIARLLRQGNSAKSVINHILCMADTIDELKLAALSDKDATQDRLLDGLKAEFEEGESTMAIRKLGQPKQAEEEAPAQEEAASPEDDVVSGSQAHKDKIEELATAGAKNAFSADIQQKLGALDGKPAEEPAPAPEPQKTEAPKVKKAKKAKAAPDKAAESTPDADTLTSEQRLDAIVELFRTAVENIMRL